MGCSNHPKLRGILKTGPMSILERVELMPKTSPKGYEGQKRMYKGGLENYTKIDAVGIHTGYIFIMWYVSKSHGNTKTS